MFLSSPLYLLALTLSANAVAVVRDLPPFALLSYGSFKGLSEDGVDRFLGIGYAQPPYAFSTTV